MTNSVKTSTTAQKIYYLDFNWTTQLTKAMLWDSEPKMSIITVSLQQTKKVSAKNDTLNVYLIEKEKRIYRISFITI